MTIAVVTGAASGIGQATKLLFEERGWDVLGIDRTPGEGVSVADITSEEQLAEVAAQLAPGDVGALVLAAGIWRRDDGRFSDVSAECWTQTWNVNVTGTMLCMRTFVPLLATGGSIVTFSSMAALAGMPRRDAYTASKGAIAALSRAWAADLVRNGIRVNCLAPGVVETPMTGDVSQDYSTTLPLGRAARADEVAATAFALCDPRLGYLNGAVIPVDGGLTAGSAMVSLAPRRRPDTPQR
jgi:3alpha(or 20beta)-hydroxysteroid dehydrogenase